MTTKRKSSIRKSFPRARTPSTSKVQATVAGKRPITPRYVYYFGDGHADGSGGMKPLLGGKGANLHEMTRIGLPVPPGFTITTEVCSYFYDHNRAYPRQLRAQVADALARVEKSVG
jgi:pyruvate,orthophosphate dikinase